MTSRYECEVRYPITHFDAFKIHLQSLGAQVLFPYSFYDYYYRPRFTDWDPLERNIRIRRWLYPDGHPTAIYYTETEVETIDGVVFKRSIFSQGKVEIVKGSLEKCQTYLESRGYEPWFVLQKVHAYFWRLADHGFDTVTEYILGYGWSGELEFEGDDPHEAGKQIAHALEVLKISQEDVTHEPLSVIVPQKWSTQGGQHAETSEPLQEFLND